MPRKKQHYVDNEKFLIVMRDYRENYLKSKDDDTEPPQIPDYAGECFLKIAERLSHRPNFINYAFREEMVSDGIENCVMYASNFNPEKSTNPFAYFTQIIYYAFLRRIEKEIMMQKQISVSTLNWGPCVIKLKIEDVFKELLLTESKNNTEDYRSKLAGILDKETGYNAKSKDKILPFLSQYIGVYDQMYQKFTGKPYEKRPEYI